MTDKESELERQIEKLTVAVSRLRKAVAVGFVFTGVLLITGFTNRDLMVVVATVGIVLWALAVIGNSLGTALARRYRKSRGHSTA